MTSKDNTLYLLDMLGRPIKSLHQDSDTRVETEKDSYSTLSTTVPYDSDITTDMQIIYRNERYIISDITDSRDRDYLMSDIKADSVYMKLSDVYKDINVDSSTIELITRTLLSDTEWTVGTIPRGVGGRHSLSLAKRDSSVLATLRLLERLSDGELKLQFDTINHKVSFVRPVEYDAEFLFQYGVNIEGISREITAPKATVLIPLGNDDMGISSVTEGNVNFVENYGYYLSQGYSLEEARANFEKIGEFKDDRFLVPGNLMREAERRLETLAFPQIAYSTTIAYLDTPVKVGMTGYVLDNDLGIKVKSEIVRVIEEKEYNRSQVELNYLIPGLGDLQDFVSDSSPGTKIAYTQISRQFTSKTDLYEALFQLSLTNLTSSNMSVGFWFQTETATPGTLLDGYFDLDGTRTGHVVRQTLGGSDSHGYPFILTQVPEGSHILRFMVKSEGGTFTVANESGSLHVESEALAGSTSSGPPVIDYTEYVELPPFMHVDDEFTIELSDISKILTALDLPPQTTEISIGDTLQLEPIATPSNAVYETTWSSSDESIATVSSTGLVSAVGNGSTIIKVVTDNGITATVDISVGIMLTALDLPPQTSEISIGDALQLEPIATPSNAVYETTWSSSDESIATVSSTGLVSAVGNGTTTIKVVTDNGITATVDISVGTVGTILTALDLPPQTTKISIGDTLQLEPIATPSNAVYETTWSSSDESIATVSSTGLVSAVGDGTTTIKVVTDNGITATVDIRVGETLTAINVIPKMTSNTSPSPFVISASSSASSGASPYMAFDGVYGKYWATEVFELTGWLKVDTGGPTTINSYAIEEAMDTNSMPHTWTLEGSDDDVDWTIVDSRSSITSWSVGERRQFDIGSDVTFRYYRLNITRNNGDIMYAVVGELALMYVY